MPHSPQGLARRLVYRPRGHFENLVNPLRPDFIFLGSFPGFKHQTYSFSCPSLVFQSLYDSSGTPIYEPIQSRPPSQMSNRSNYSSSTSSMYYPYLSTKPSNSSNLRTQMPSHSQPATRATSREAEVDHLTDLLVQSMDASANPEFFGQSFLFKINLR